MRFKVPQFLDIEDKIFDPFTFSELAYLAGGGAIIYLLYKTLGLFFGIIPILIIAGLAVALVWYKPNGAPFIDMIEASFKYFMQDKLYIWKKDWTKNEINEKEKKKGVGFDKLKGGENRASKLSGSKLKDLAWSLDVLDLKK